MIERQEKAPILLDVLILEAIPEKISENLEEKLKALQRVFELLAPLKEHLAATERVVTVAKTLGLKSDSGTILQQYREYLSRQKEKAYPTHEKAKIVTSEEEIEIEEHKQHQERVTNVQESGPLSKSEKVFIREIVCHPEFLTHPNRDEFLAYIGHNEVKRLFQWLVKIYFEIDEAEYVPIVQDELQAGGYSKEIKDIATDALFNYGNKYNEKVVQRMLKDYKVMLRMDQLRNKRRALVERQKTSHTQNEVDHLMVEISNLDKEISNLKNTVP